MAQLVERMMEKDLEQRPSMVLVAGELERLAGKLVPGGQPVVVMTNPTGPASSGQHPTAPTLSVAMGSSSADKSGEKSEPAVTEPDPPRPSGGRGLFFVLVLLILGGGGAYAWYSGAYKVILARLQPPPPPPPPPELVYWSVNSIPSDAQVVRKSDGTSLGKTPWEHSQPKGAGKVVIIVRKAGYKDIEIELDESQSQTPPVASLAPIEAETAPSDLGTATAAAPDLAPAAVNPEGTPAGTPNLPRKLLPKLPKKGPNLPAGTGTLTDDDISTDLDKK
jgi:hypothetical protein